jgi:flagellar assembly protein FliH
MSSKLLREGKAADAPTAAFRHARGPAISSVIYPQASAGGYSRSAELEAQLAAAEQRGHAAGEASGATAAMKRAAEHFAPVLASLNELIQELGGLRGRVRKEAEAGTVDLALAVARRILNRELSLDPEAITGLVRTAMDRLNVREMHQLRLSPGDFAVIDAQRAHLHVPASVTLTADPTLSPGSAIFSTARGEVDASIQTQLEEIHRGLADLIRRQR